MPLSIGYLGMEVLNSILVIGAVWFFFYMHLVTWRCITGYGREEMRDERL